MRLKTDDLDIPDPVLRRIVRAIEGGTATPEMLRPWIGEGRPVGDAVQLLRACSDLMLGLTADTVVTA